MDRSDTAYLIGKDFVPDAYGVQREMVSPERKVFVQVNSVTAAEWFEGGRSGLNPEFRFTMFRYDYNGEEEIKYNGKYYRIYRTYLGRNDSIELYCERRKGNADH